MAIKGFSIPVFGTYTNDGGTVTYADPTIMDKAVEYSLSWTTGDDNPFYADNGIAENDRGTFQGGELTLTTADLSQEVSKAILGTKTMTETYSKEKTATVQVFDDDYNPPYLGVGFIEMHQVNDVNKYRAIFLHKVHFNVPEGAATTKGEDVDWQTPELSGAVSRSDASGENGIHPWMSDAWFESESEALLWLKFKCGAADATNAQSSKGKNPVS